MKENVRMKCVRLAVMAVLAAALTLSGCMPSAETLAQRGIEAEYFDAEVLEARIVDAVLDRADGFSVCYMDEAFSEEEFDRAVQRALDEHYAAGVYVEEAKWEYSKKWGYFEYHVSIEYTPERYVLDYFRNEDGAIAGMEFSEETLATIMRERLFSGVEGSTLVFETPDDLTDEDIGAMMVDFYNHDPYAAYMVSELNTSVVRFPDYTEVNFTYDMNEGHLTANEIHVVDDPIDAIDYMSECFVTGDEAAALYIDDVHFDYSVIMSWIEQALLNDAGDMCSEADEIGYMPYPGEADTGPRLLEIFATFENDAAARTACREEMRSSIEKAAAELGAEAGLSERELHRRIYDYICKKVEYDDEIADATEAETLTKEMLIQRTAYGALIDGKTVCSGYAAAYKALCDELGLECCVIYGSSRDGPHAWNIVRIDGEVYYVDATAGDMSWGSDSYFLFNERTLIKEEYKVDESYVMPWQ